MISADIADDEEDEQLRLAIALSLQEAGRQDSADRPIELSSDEDEEDLDRPPVYHRQDAAKAPQRNRDDDTRASKKDDTAAPATANAFSLMGMDRKKMEEERLARLRKRKAPDSEQDAQDRLQRLRTGPAAGYLQAKTEAIGKPAVSAPTASSTSPLVASAKVNPNALGLRFPRGAVKKTWAFGYSRNGDDIKIEEVLQKNELELAVLSSFVWDEEWMMSKIDIRRTKVVCIAFASSKEQQEEMRANVPKDRIKFCFPPMLPMGNMHSKLQLLKFPKYLRVVVPSGNLVGYDWGETGVMENMVFLIDLPRLENAEIQAASKLTTFGEDLCYFLQAQGLEESLIRSLENYDFSETRSYAFVHSIGQSHLEDSWKRTGYCGLGRAVSALGLNAPDPIDIDFVVSSLGAVKNDLLTAIYYAAQGDSGLKEYEGRTGKGKKAKGGGSNASVSRLFRDHFRIYFPSLDTVANSRGGKSSAGTICAQSKWWNADTFPRSLIHECKSVRNGLLMHDKIMFVRQRQSAQRPALAAAWAYVGSANLSESAWGRLTKDKQTGNPKLTCRNWECGVIVPVPVAGEQKSASQGNAELDAIFKDCVPVPMQVPSEAYGEMGSKRPWFFMEN